MRFLAVLLLFTGVSASFAKTPVVPRRIQFANMTLVLRDGVRQEIQREVDAQFKSLTYYQAKVERVKTYFPLIEKVFNEEGLPDDFKYLALQESDLIADAVSVSDAVGFWQFKDLTAKEVGLRVDRTIDERMNIISASRGAAIYLKRNNKMFDNWIYALQSYQMGAGGVKRLIGSKGYGDRTMTITSKTYWYVKKFIAIKIAFQDALDNNNTKNVVVIPVQNETVKNFTTREHINEAEFRAWNKWIKLNHIPNDKVYYAVLPAKGNQFKGYDQMYSNTDNVQLFQNQKTTSESVKQINGLIAMRAYQNETIETFSRRMAVSVENILKYNDLVDEHQWISNRFYFKQKKKTRGVMPSTVVQGGENWWLVSQRTGVQLKKLLRYNKDQQNIMEGQIIRLKPRSFFTWIFGGKVKNNTKKPVSPPQSNETVEPSISQQPEFQERISNRITKSDISDISTISENVTLHEVQPNETLYSIAKKYNIDVSEIIENNKLSSNTIKAGQILNIATQGNDKPAQFHEFTLYEVKPSDTIFSVSRNYGITIEDLMKWNNKDDFSLSIGEKLKIYKP